MLPRSPTRSTTPSRRSTETTTRPAQQLQLADECSLAGAAVPGNVFLPASATGLPRDSVVNVTALVTLDKHDLGEPGGTVPSTLMDDVERGLRLVLEL